MIIGAFLFLHFRFSPTIFFDDFFSLYLFVLIEPVVFADFYFYFYVDCALCCARWIRGSPFVEFVSLKCEGVLWVVSCVWSWSFFYLFGFRFVRSLIFEFGEILIAILGCDCFRWGKFCSLFRLSFVFSVLVVFASLCWSVSNIEWIPMCRAGVGRVFGVKVKENGLTI